MRASWLLGSAVAVLRIVCVPVGGGGDGGAVTGSDGGAPPPASDSGALASDADAGPATTGPLDYTGEHDLNCDGYADVAVSEPSHAAPDGTLDGGRVWVYFGAGGGLDAVPDVEIVDPAFVPGSAAADAFGRALASGGDVDGDGCADLVVGAAGAPDAGGAAAGAAFLYRGGAGFDALADATLSCPSATACGRAVDLSADVNGDGYHDVLVGASGAALLFLGGPGPTFDATPDATYTGATTAFGTRVALAPDVNGDGYDDVLVAAPPASVFVFQGGPAAPFDLTPDAELVSTVPLWTGAPYEFGLRNFDGDLFGASIAGVGDVTGDGYGDVLVGAPGTDYGTGGLVLTRIEEVGASYFYAGGPGGLDPTAPVISGGAPTVEWPVESGCEDTTLQVPPGHERGTAVARAGDVDGDGLADFVVSSPRDSTWTGCFSGSIHVESPVGAWWEIGRNPGPAFPYVGSFGADVAGVGDVNGDGFDDVAVSIWSWGVAASEVQVFLGPPPGYVGVVPASTMLVPAAPGGQFGYAVAH
ncbi:MAG TPA: VCBS repeat-containing protein [Myxococcota bacterium]|nr:VCBS repeat-containing protein [Myxococcota bacterium]